MRSGHLLHVRCAKGECECECETASWSWRGDFLCAGWENAREQQAPPAWQWMRCAKRDVAGDVLMRSVMECGDVMVCGRSRGSQQKRRGERRKQSRAVDSRGTIPQVTCSMIGA